MQLITPLAAMVVIFLQWFLTQPSYATTEVKHYHDIVWASPKGFDLTLDIAAPKTNAKQALPTLVIFHGGGWLLNNKSIMSDLATAITQRANMITVNVNYRLLSDLDNTTTVNEIIEDAMGAVLWVKTHIREYGGDPQQIAVTGDSAGGHLAAMVALAGRQLDSDGFDKPPLKFTPTYLPTAKSAEQIAASDELKVQAVILSYAGFDMLKIASNGFETASNAFWQYAKVEPRGMFGKAIHLDQHPEYYRAVSPNQYLVAAKDYAFAPMLLQVGEMDRLTPAASAKAFAQQLTELQQPVTLKIYKNRAHGYLDSGCNDYNNGCFDELAEPALSDMVEFLRDVFKLPEPGREFPLKGNAVNGI